MQFPENRNNKKLLSYIITSAGGLFVTYLYNVVDGIFVGRGVGPLALAAVNITVPYVTVLAAVSVLLAMGGSTIIAIHFGQQDIESANQAFMNTFVLTIALSLLLLLIGTVFSEQIARLCGSSDATLPMAKEYLFYYTAFSLPFILSNCISIFVRNDGAPRLAFISMCVGAATNIFLDWLFIFPFGWGLRGAAIASGLGQVFSCFLLMGHFMLRRGQLRIRRFRFSYRLSLEIMRRGIPECLSQLNTPVTAFCFNWVLRNELGDPGVATFSIMSFICALVNSLLSGVAQGLQPLWGQAYGRRDNQDLAHTLRSGLIINVLCSIGIYALLTVFRVPVVALFTKDEILKQMAAGVLPIFGLSFFFMAVNLIYTAFYYSTKQTGKADVIALSRGIFIKAVCIFLVPALFGIAHVWYAVLAAEFITMLICLFFQHKQKLVSGGLHYYE